jgi:hypothetical protein
MDMEKPTLGLRRTARTILLAGFSSAICLAGHSQTLGDALNAPELTWITAGAVAWQVDTNTTHDGDAAVNSGTLALGQNNSIQTSVAGPTAVTFWYKTSSCQGYGTLSFSVGGVLQMSTSGDVDWQQADFYVPPGETKP